MVGASVAAAVLLVGNFGDPASFPEEDAAAAMVSLMHSSATASSSGDRVEARLSAHRKDYLRAHGTDRGEGKYRLRVRLIRAPGNGRYTFRYYVNGRFEFGKTVTLD
jgi:hypothetical protein